MELPVHHLLRAFAQRQADSVQLYAGTNWVSPLAEQALANSIGAMPAIGPPHAKQQPGTGEISDLEQLVHAQVLALFGGQWAEVRLPTCTIANAAVVAAFSLPGDLVAAIAPADGGHVSHQAQGTVGLLGRTSVALPFRDGCYDDAAAAQLIRARAPRIVLLGASVMLHPYAMAQTAAACQASGALLVYDASHVLGLVAGRRFQDPLALGADLMTASTYKSFGGPPGSIVVGRHAQHAPALQASVAGPWASNYDAARLAALSVALAEAEQFMAGYADAMLSNATALSQALAERGCDVVPGSQTHQLLVRCGDRTQAAVQSRAAEACGLLIGTGSVPGQPGMAALRIGTQAVTRRGAGASDMVEVAEALHALLRQGDAAACTRIARSLATRLTRVHYCF